MAAIVVGGKRRSFYFLKKIRFKSSDIIKRSILG